MKPPRGYLYHISIPQTLQTRPSTVGCSMISSEEGKQSLKKTVGNGIKEDYGKGLKTPKLIWLARDMEGARFISFD